MFQKLAQENFSPTAIYVLCGVEADIINVKSLKPYGKISLPVFVKRGIDVMRHLTWILWGLSCFFLLVSSQKCSILQHSLVKISDCMFDAMFVKTTSQTFCSTFCMLLKPVAKQLMMKVEGLAQRQHRFNREPVQCATSTPRWVTITICLSYSTNIQVHESVFGIKITRGPFGGWPPFTRCRMWKIFQCVTFDAS